MNSPEIPRHLSIYYKTCNGWVCRRSRQSGKLVVSTCKCLKVGIAIFVGELSVSGRVEIQESPFQNHHGHFFVFNSLPQRNACPSKKSRQKQSKNKIGLPVVVSTNRTKLSQNGYLAQIKAHHLHQKTVPSP